MINFSRVGLIEDLKKAIAELPDETSSASAAAVAHAKAGANLMLDAIKTNGAQINLRVNRINDWLQTECQVCGQTINPPKAS